MKITKSEAMVMLAMSTGNADGEFSIQEIDDAITKTPALRQAMKDAESTDWLSKYRTRELNSESAIKALNQFSIEEKTEVMAICWEIVLSDGKITDGEKIMMDKWLVTLGLKMEDVIEKHKQMYL